MLPLSNLARKRLIRADGGKGNYMYYLDQKIIKQNRIEFYC